MENLKNSIMVFFDVIFGGGDILIICEECNDILVIYCGC